MHRTSAPGRFAVRLFTSLVLVASLHAAAGAQEIQRTPEMQARIRAIKDIEREQLREGTQRVREARQEARERRERVARLRRTARGRAVLAKGARIRPVVEAEMLPPPDEDRGRVRLAAPTAVSATNDVPTNVRCNNPALQSDLAGAGQAEQWSVSSGSNVLVAWNDGQGFNSGLDTQGYAYSTNGGASFTDGGDVPKPPGMAGWKWGSDPVVGVNEKTGRFYYCGLGSPDASHNAIGVAYGHFSGASFLWDSVVVVRNESNASFFLDKQWLAADSLNNDVYISNTTFTVTGDQIDFYRSTNGGASWSLAQTVSDNSVENGVVQGSRVAVGPAGEVYVVWQSLGQFDPDFYFIRKSTNAGVTFGSRTQAVQYLANFGTGAPGFNRNRGLTFPSIAVDRTTGTNRGRVYLAWNESIDWYQYAVAIHSGSHVNEPATDTGLNNVARNAVAFTPGDTLRGSLSGSADLDYFKFNLNAGQSITVFADSLQSFLTYTCRIFAPAPDSVQRLCFGGATSASATPSRAIYMFTAPVTGTYYLRMAGISATNAQFGPYRVVTNFATKGSERGRDQRDVFVNFSDNGTTWSIPVRVNTSAVGLDEYLAEITVGADGCPYVSWFDFRNDTYGSRNHQFLARSNSGGGTWVGNVAFTSAQGNFTTSGSNIAPNMGDYSSLTADARYVRPTWADARGSDVDVWSTAIDVSHDITSCPGAQNAVANMTLPLGWTLHNNNPLFSNTLSYTLASQRNWPMPSASTLALLADSTGALLLNVAIPDTAADGVNVLTLTVKSQRAGISRTCVVPVTINHVLVGVDDDRSLGFALHGASPNPAHGLTRIAYSVPAAGAVRLAVYGLQGERVRTLEDGTVMAGRHSIAWDGRDEHGRVVPAGTYFVRLEGFGRQAVSRMVWMQ